MAKFVRPRDTNKAYFADARKKGKSKRQIGHELKAGRHRTYWLEASILAAAALIALAILQGMARAAGQSLWEYLLTRF